MGRYDDHVVKDYMDYFAKWGPKGFLYSDTKIVPFWGLSTGYALKEGNNTDTSGTEPTNTTGRAAQTITFNTRYALYLGTDPKAQMHDWYDLAEDVWPFYVGGQQFGPPLLQLQDVQWSNHLIDASGRLISVDAAITLREWYEGIELDQGWYVPPQVDTGGLLLSTGDIFSSGASNADIIWTFLRTNGFSAAATAGAMGNFEAESGLIPDTYEIGNSGYGGSKGYGIAQWTNTGPGQERRDWLMNWCNSNGYDYRTLEGQLNYLLYEYDKQYYQNLLGASYKACTNVWQATDDWLTYFEGCTLHQAEAQWSRRINSANTFYNKYKDYVQVPSTVVSTGGSGIGAAGDGIATGSFSWPFAGGAGYLTQDLGVNYGGSSSYLYGGNSDHLGNDISTTGGSGAGSPVLAIDGGTVQSVQRWNGSIYGNQSYGNCVVVNHGNGYFSRYAHLYSISVASGQAVSQGQQLGIEGSTGNSSGTHLHIELRTGSEWGTVLNPQNYMHR